MGQATARLSERVAQDFFPHTLAPPDQNHSRKTTPQVILTKMDDSSGTKSKGGGALSAVAATGAPVVFLGSGEHFDDFVPFRAEGFVSKLLGLGDVKGLVETMQESFLDMEGLQQKLEQAERSPGGGGVPEINIEDVVRGEHKGLFSNITKGKFTLRNLQGMFRSMGSMGGMGGLLGMMPGMGGMMGGMPGMPGQNPQMDKEREQQMQKLGVYMDSMTDYELDGLIPIEELQKSESRKKRIARGSGCRDLRELDALFEQHKRIEGMVGKMGGLDMNNPLAAFQKLSGAMDPAMRAQMGR